MSRCHHWHNTRRVVCSIGRTVHLNLASQIESHLSDLLYKAQKPSLHPSACLHFLVEWISAIGVQIDITLARNEALVFWDHQDYFYKFQIAK